MQSYPIRAVATLTGLSVDTLRAWERRYQAVVPGRDRRGRSYSAADVARLQRLGVLVRRGHAIGTIAGLSDGDLKSLVGAGDHPTDGRSGPPVADLEAVTAALDRYDLAIVEAFLNRHAVVLPPHELVFAVVLPLLRALGERWQAGRLRPSQEHLVSAAVRNVLGGLLRATMRPHVSPQVIFATLAHERHELGVLCAALLAATAGFRVVYLGPDLPAGDVAHAVTHTGARVVVLGATIVKTTGRKDARVLSGLGPDVTLFVGGPEAGGLAQTIGPRAHVIERLESLLPTLADRA